VPTSSSFNTGTISFAGIPTVVPLGEIRSDVQNHLIVLGASTTRPRRRNGPERWPR
jgi:hypothetical protein